MKVRTIIKNKLCPTLSDLKSHLRVTSADLDYELTNKLMASVSACEHNIGKTIAISDFVLTANFAKEVLLDFNIIDVVSVSVNGLDISSSHYRLNDNGTIIFDDSITDGQLKIIYKAGYIDVPYDIRLAILLVASRLFSNPIDSADALPSISMHLLQPYRSY